jgi:hypothetical protein
VVRGDRPVQQGSRVEAQPLDGIELQLVVLVEVLQEPLVDGVQVEDQEVVHGSITATTG